MRGLLCGKMSVTYQSVEIGKGSKGSNALYKTGPWSQQCVTGPDGASTYKLPLPQTQNQSDTALFNLLSSYSKYYRSQSPDSTNCCNSLAPLNLPKTLRCDDGGEDKSPVSPLFSSLSSLGGTADGQTSSEDGASTGDGRAESKCWGSGSNSSTDSVGQGSEYEMNTNVIDLSGKAGPVEAGARLFQNYYVQQPGMTGLLHLNDTGPELSSSSSSIGNRSEDSRGSVDNEDSDMEVESALRKGPLDMMNALKCSLPIKRGLSRFWSGKSKSFTSLADVSSVSDLAKPENPFNKRRRYAASADRHRSFPPLSRTSTAGISKRPPSGSGRSNLAMAVAMGSKLESASKHSSSTSALPPTGRSFSLTDLQHASNTVSPPLTPKMRMRRC